MMKISFFPTYIHIPINDHVKYNESSSIIVTLYDTNGTNSYTKKGTQLPHISLNIPQGDEKNSNTNTVQKYNAVKEVIS